MTPKKRFLLLTIFLTTVIGVMLYFAPHLLLSGKMLYDIGEKRYKAGDHECYHDMDKVKSAIYYFEKAFKKGYYKRELFHKLMYCYSISNDIINEERILTIGLIHHPLDATFYFYRGNCRKDSGDPAGALQDYDKAITINHNFDYLQNAFYYRGAMKYILGDTVKANLDRLEAQKIASHELRSYADYSSRWK